MSLRAFHLVFMTVSVILAAFCAAWAVGEYRAAHDGAYMAGAIVSLAGAVGLAAYGAAFQRKTRHL